MGGNLVLRAGLLVTLNDGFTVHSGGELTVEIDPTIPPQLRLAAVRPRSRR